MTQEGKKILYLGEDTTYFKVLGAEFQRLYPGVNFKQFSESTPESIQALNLKVFTLQPALVFVDFSKHSDDYIHLARTLVRTNRLNKVSVVGLHDYLSPLEQIKEAFLAGVELNHIKGAEIFDVVFGAINLVTPGEAKEHGFATAQLSEEFTASHLAKVGFIHTKGLHFETTVEFSQGEELRIRHHWLNKKMIPSSLVKVKKSSTSLLFYCKRAIDVDFAWVDPVIRAEGDDEARVNEMNTERDHLVTKAKKALQTWLDDNTERSQKKSVRVLIVDRKMVFYQYRERIDKYGYSIRCQPFMADMSSEIDSQRPQVIAFALDSKPEDGSAIPDPANDLGALQKLTQMLRQKFSDLNPFIVVFNSPATSQELKSSLKYEQIISQGVEISPEILLKMANVFDKKLSAVTEPIKDPNADQKQVFIKKTAPMSIAEIDDVLKLVQISESDAVFECNRSLPPGTTLRLETPFKGYLTVVNHPQLSKAPAYYALVNGISEIEKKDLRRYVNTIFFKDLDATKLGELESFQSLNKAKWQEILDKQKAKLEAEEKARQEEAQKKLAEKKAEAEKESQSEPGGALIDASPKDE